MIDYAGNSIDILAFLHMASDEEASPPSQRWCILIRCHEVIIIEVDGANAIDDLFMEDGFT